MLQACYFRSFCHAWLCTPKVILSTCSKLLYLSAGKKQLHPPRFSGDIALEILQRHGKLLILDTLCLATHKPKTLVSTFRKLR